MGTVKQLTHALSRAFNTYVLIINAIIRKATTVMTVMHPLFTITKGLFNPYRNKNKTEHKI